MEKKKLIISILGDVCPTSDWKSMFDNGEPEKLFGSVLPHLQEADYCVANLECPVTDRKKALKKCGPNQKAVPSDLIVLKLAGIDAVSLANNHIKDFCSEGILDTFSELEKQEIAWFGAGKSKDCLVGIHYRSFDGVTIGFASFAEQEFNLASYNEAGAMGFDPYDSFDLIAEWKDHCDYLVILYHGGIEHYRYPSPLLQKKCRKMISTGADLVLCQHSHCIGTIEEYCGGTILYGQGNTVFGYRDRNNAWNEGLLVQLIFDGEKYSLKYYLIRATERGLLLVDEKDSESRLRQINKESENVNDDAFISDSWKQFCNRKKAEYLAMLIGKSRVFNKLNRMLNNRMLKWTYSSKAEMISMNLIRCDAHREVIQTMLEEDVNG